MTDQNNFQPPWMEVEQTNPSPVVNPAVNSSQSAPVTPPPAPNFAQSENTPVEPAPVNPPPGLPLIVSSPFKKIIPFLGIAVIIIIIVFIVRTILTKKSATVQTQTGTTTAKKEAVTLTYWGLWESNQIMQPLIAEYQKNNPHVTINYVFQASKDYRERLQSALAAGTGPDIFKIHNTWLPMFKQELSSAPDTLVDWSDYFSSISDLKSGNKYYAVPLGFDTLALYYNVDLLTAAGKKPPTDWKELRETAIALRTPATGAIQIGGVALGTTANVDHWSDILALMMLQNGVDLNNPTGQFAAETLKFYSLFSKVDRVWDETLPNSVYAFANGKVAMIFAPSWRAFEIKELNPKLNFRTVVVPQLSGTQIAWATFWAEAVSKNSKNQETAWDFIKFLSQKENLKKLYTYEAQTRLFGEPYPTKSLAKDLESDPVVGAFVKQGSYAKSWYLCSFTHDNGLNDRMIKYYQDAINGVIQGKDANQVLEPLQSGVTQVLGQYQITAK